MTKSATATSATPTATTHHPPAKPASSTAPYPSKSTSNPHPLHPASSSSSSLTARSHPKRTLPKNSSTSSASRSTTSKLKVRSSRIDRRGITTRRRIFREARMRISCSILRLLTRLGRIRLRSAMIGSIMGSRMMC